jgi:hypothetical protein
MYEAAYEQTDEVLHLPVQHEMIIRFSRTILHPSNGAVETIVILKKMKMDMLTHSKANFFIESNNTECRHFADAIIDLHERGYCQDFVLFGNDLLWIQEKIFIRSKDFSILECHQFAHPDGNNEDLIILGVLATDNNVRGILMNHYTYSSKMPQSIVAKLRKLRSFHYEG